MLRNSLKTNSSESSNVKRPDPSSESLDAGPGLVATKLNKKRKVRSGVVVVGII